MTLSRRRFLLAAAPLALAGCSASFQQHVTNFADTLFTDVMIVAAYLEGLVKQVVAKTLTVAQAADAFLAKGAPYVVPGLKIFVSLVKLAGQVGAANQKLASDKNFQAALGQASALAANPIIQTSVATNAMPSDPLAIVTGIIDLGSQIYAISQGAASPTAAAATA